jgi:hypothetical protein
VLVFIGVSPCRGILFIRMPYVAGAELFIVRFTIPLVAIFGFVWILPENNVGACHTPVTVVDHDRALFSVSITLNV